MVRMCGRFGFDLDKCWEITPGEFEDLIAGGVERERETKLGFALLSSLIAKTMGGVYIHPLAFLGEDADYGDSPVAADLTPADKYRRKLDNDRKMAQEKFEAWLAADGIDLTSIG